MELALDQGLLENKTQRNFDSYFDFFCMKTRNYNWRQIPLRKAVITIIKRLMAIKYQNFLKKIGFFQYGLIQN